MKKKKAAALNGRLPFRAREIPEKLLQFIWQNQYFNSSSLISSGGEPIEVIFPGKWNKDQGPDFLEARIRIGTTLMAGSVELHLQSSQWLQHNHQHDVNYNNVILHVVMENDGAGALPTVPVLELEGRISSLLLERYEELMHTPVFIPCETAIQNVPELVLVSWRDRMVVERLQRKAAMFYQFVEQSKGSWEEAFWWQLARNFGMRVNNDAFENMARMLPMNLLRKHRYQLQQLEALMLGGVGLLEGSFADKYAQLLQKEYRFLSRKYGLTATSIPAHFLRMRPQNFPTIRLAQLAALIQKEESIFQKLLHCNDPDEIRQMLEVNANDYWHYRYRFDEPSAYRIKSLGQDMIDNILINTIVPALFSYGRHHQNEGMRLRALHWLEETRAEENSTIAGFRNCGISTCNAFDSQALIELKSQYCDEKKCLSCAIGNELLKAT